MKDMEEANMGTPFSSTVRLLPNVSVTPSCDDGIEVANFLAGLSVHIEAREEKDTVAHLGLEMVCDKVSKKVQVKKTSVKPCSSVMGIPSTGEEHIRPQDRGMNHLPRHVVAREEEGTVAHLGRGMVCDKVSKKVQVKKTSSTGGEHISARDRGKKRLIRLKSCLRRDCSKRAKCMAHSYEYSIQIIIRQFIAETTEELMMF